MVQTPSEEFDGKRKSISMEAYTPLIELKEKLPPLGYSILKNQNIMQLAYKLTSENLRAPVVEPTNDEILHEDFVANSDDTWITFIRDFIGKANNIFSLDNLSRVLFSSKQDTASLQPVWTYTDDNSSILYPDITVDRDLYGIPNVVEVIYSTADHIYYSRIVNDDPNSPISTIARGREIVHRVTDPNIVGVPSDRQVEEYASKLLQELSTLEYTISYTHGYCPVNIGQCVRFNYTRFGLQNIKARVISQSIKCEKGCPVTEKAVFTKKLWR